VQDPPAARAPPPVAPRPTTTPTAPPGLWFGKLTDKAIRRGVFHSVPELINAIETYLQANNESPEPFVWTATAEQILTKVQRGRVTLNQLANQN
jgi:hypothetical protein